MAARKPSNSYQFGVDWVEVAIVALARSNRGSHLAVRHWPERRAFRIPICTARIQAGAA